MGEGKGSVRTAGGQRSPAIDQHPHSARPRATQPISSIKARKKKRQESRKQPRRREGKRSDNGAKGNIKGHRAAPPARRNAQCTLHYAPGTHPLRSPEGNG
eukprot:scaffold17491_cov114-Isochrysis_galbana.AAC.2